MIRNILKIMILLSVFCSFRVSKILEYSQNLDEKILKKKIVSYTFPGSQKNGKLEYENFSFSIYHNDKYEIYEFPLTKSYRKINNNTVKIDSIVVKSQYLVAERGNILGLFYSDNSTKKVKKDSLISKYLSFKDISVDSLNTAMKLFRLITIEKLQNGTTEEKYVPINQNGTSPTIPDTLCTYFSDSMKDLDYSFSKTLDSLKKSKYVGFRGVFLSKRYPIITVEVPTVQTKLEMKEAPIDNEKIILKMIQQFETDKHLLQQ